MYLSEFTDNSLEEKEFIRGSSVSVFSQKSRSSLTSIFRLVGISCLIVLYSNCSGNLTTLPFSQLTAGSSGSSISLITVCNAIQCSNSAAEPIIYSTPNSIGVEWLLAGDNNHNGSVV